MKSKDGFIISILNSRMKRIEKISSYFLDLSKRKKLFISLLVDTFLCLFTTWLSFYLRLGEVMSLDSILFLPALISIIFAIPVFYLSGLYKTVFRYSGWPAMITVSKSIFIYGCVF